LTHVLQFWDCDNSFFMCLFCTNAILYGGNNAKKMMKMCYFAYGALSRVFSHGVNYNE